MNPITAFVHSFLQDEAVLQDQMVARVTKNKNNSVQVQAERNGPVHTDKHWQKANNLAFNDGIPCSYHRVNPAYAMHSLSMGRRGEQANSYASGIAYCEEMEEIARKEKEAAQA
jgi:hypothetical protein